MKILTMLLHYFVKNYRSDNFITLLKNYTGPTTCNVNIFLFLAINLIWTLTISPLVESLSSRLHPHSGYVIRSLMSNTLAHGIEEHDNN